MMSNVASNWVELGKPGISDVLGRGGDLGGAGELETTCSECSGLDTTQYVVGSFLSICMDCSGIEAGHNQLTSGYYFGEDAKPKIEGKCHHGMNYIQNILTCTDLNRWTFR